MHLISYGCSSTHLDDAAPEAVDHGVEAGGGQGEGLSKYRGDEEAAEAEHPARLHQPRNIHVLHMYLSIFTFICAVLLACKGHWFSPCLASGMAGLRATIAKASTPGVLRASRLSLR